MESSDNVLELPEIIQNVILMETKVLLMVPHMHVVYFSLRQQRVASPPRETLSLWSTLCSASCSGELSPSALGTNI